MHNTGPDLDFDNHHLSPDCCPSSYHHSIPRSINVDRLVAATNTFEPRDSEEDNCDAIPSCAGIPRDTTRSMA